jgi:hypothetical protein
VRNLEGNHNNQVNLLNFQDNLCTNDLTLLEYNSQVMARGPQLWKKFVKPKTVVEENIRAKKI